MAKKESKEKKAPAQASATQSLAVTHRPVVLKDVVGQDQQVAIIKGMIKERKYPGAILITGPTGTGKTTLARILSTYMNADDPKNVRESMAFRMGDKHPDVTVVNAGISGKVDDIRTLVKGSRSAPMTNYRIIIIDEAHKLTGASAEALLVPMEEPPARTIWILCTTDPEKLLATISNRCTKINLKAVEPEHIVARLEQIVELEGLKFAQGKEGKKALKLIASLSDGSMRNAISHLEALMFAAASGSIDFSAEGALKAYVESAAVDLDKACASVVAAALNFDLPSAISLIRRADNARGIINKSRWLLDYLIGAKTKTAKFTPYSGRVFEQLIKKMDIKYGLSKLLVLQQVITNVELQMNSCSINEAVLLQTAIGNFIIENKSE